MQNRYDVIIVGAGTAGLFTALKISQLGHSVLVVEKMPKESCGSKMDQFHMARSSFEKYEIHDSPFIPNIPNSGDTARLQQDKAYAIEPFTTNGYGMIQPGKITNIFEFAGMKKKKNMKLEDVSLAQKFKSQIN